MKHRLLFVNSTRGQAKLAVIAIAFSGVSAFAADSTWNTQVNNLSWSLGTWTSGVPGATSGTTSTDTATFNNAGNFTINGFNANRNIGSIVYGTTGASANNFVHTSSGNLLLTNGGSISADSTYRGISNINIGPIFQGASGSYTFTSSGLTGSGLIMNGAMTPAAGLGTYALNLGGTNTGIYNQINGAIGNSAATITVTSLAKSGTGTWVLGGTNTFTGGTTLNGGTVVTNNASALGTTGAIAVTGSTTLRTTTAPTDPSGRITISDGATLTIDSVGSSGNTWSSAIGNSGASNTAGLTKTGLGTMTLQTVIQTYKGDTTVNAGVLTIKANNQVNIVDSSSKLVLGGGTINFTGTNAQTQSQAFNNTTLNPGISLFVPAASSGTNTVDFGLINRTTGSLLNITTAGGYSFKATGSSASAGGLIKGLTLSQNDFVKITADVLSAATYSTQNDSSLWTSGTVNYVTNGAVSGTVGTGGTTNFNALKMNNASSQSFTIDGTLVVNDGLLFGSSIGANPSEISGGNLTANGDLIIVCNNAQSTYGTNTVSSTIVDNGSPTNVILYTPLNNASLFISGANSYTGNTHVAGGFNTAGNAGSVTVGGAAGAKIGSPSATVFINGGNGGALSVLRVGNGDATGDILGTLQIDNGTLQLNRNDTSTLSANITGTKGAGYITVANTGTTTLNFASGNNTFFAINGTGAAGTLNLEGASSANTFIQSNAAATFNVNQTTNFKSGSYFLNGSANSGANSTGTWNVQGARVVVGTLRYINSGGGTINVSSGSLTGIGQFTLGEQANSRTLAINVSGTGLFDLASNSQNVNLGGGSSGTYTNNNVSLNVSGGVFQYGLAPNSAGSQNLPIGYSVATATNNAAAFNLSGGKSRVFGTIRSAWGSGTVPTGNTANFNWTGGNLTAFAIDMTGLTSNNGVSPAAAGTLFQGGASSVMAPGELYNGYDYSGKTTITGNYQIDAGSVSIGIGGTTAAGTFHDDTAKYDNVAVTGTVALAGTLNVSLRNGFIPAAQTFTILTGSSITGSFSNVSGGKVTLVGGATFDVTNTGTTLTLSNYTVPVSNDFVAWIGPFGVSDPSFGGDPDNDGLDNGVENILGSNPSVYSNGLTQISATASSFKFRHEQSNTIASDVTKTYQWSPDLVNWAASGVSIGGITATIGATTFTDVLAPGNDVIEVTVTVPPATLTKVFGRLVATKTP